MNRRSKDHTVFLPANDLVGEEDPLHLGVLDMVAALILHHLLAGRVNQTDEDVLLLPHA